MSKLSIVYVLLLLFLATELSSATLDALSSALISPVLRKAKGNTIFSPLLLSEGLMQLYMGAEGNTAVEIANLLQIKCTLKAAAIEDYYKWHRTLIAPANVNLKMGNRIYLASNVPIMEDYEHQVAEVFNATIQHVNFADSDKTVGIINRWANALTQGKITKLLDKTTEQTKLMLLGAIYFKAKWQQQFNKLHTKLRAFSIARPNGFIRTKQVETMQISANFAYRRLLDVEATAIVMPFAANLSMVILLPESIDGVDRLLENLSKVDIGSVTEEFETFITLTLPKFKFNVAIDFIKILKSLGVNDLFDMAELSAMSELTGLNVSKFLQKAFIEVSEQGAKAAAVEAIQFARGKSLTGPEVNIDHPFVFLIKDEQRVYLAGVVKDPEDKK
ncbi:leukocyte elastase inhibitor [Drosophila busckii]|uniref:leukocyte elastase inhibitor n=1 Tax=Drosophila busckii TaxID=30019 RepID=UPI00083F274B|nr:leukocyte elastase inhibitor [Drosophila busckii]